MTVLGERRKQIPHQKVSKSYTKLLQLRHQMHGRKRLPHKNCCQNSWVWRGRYGESIFRIYNWGNETNTRNPKADKKHHSATKNCYACKAEFGTLIENEEGEKEKVTKCRDCHITGRYRSAACKKCNLRMKVPKFIPNLFHNLENYDSHLFVKNLGLDDGKLNKMHTKNRRKIY